MTENRWIRPELNPHEAATIDALHSYLHWSASTSPIRTPSAAVLPPPLTPPGTREYTPGSRRSIWSSLGATAIRRWWVTSPLTQCTTTPLANPVNLPSSWRAAVAISRERFGEPEEVGWLTLVREGGRGSFDRSRRRHFRRIVGDVSASLPVRSLHATQFWFEFLPAVDGGGFDTGPLLVHVDQVRSPEP